MKLYHQLGFKENWNFESLQSDRAGDGVVLAPRYMARDKIEKFPPIWTQKWFFDPQFFRPEIPKGQLNTYNFFPDVVAQGFESAAYPSEMAQISANQCVRWQIEREFAYVVIPARYVSGMPSDFIRRQEQLFVDPFVRALADQKPDRPVLLQLLLTDHMLTDAEFAKDLLNWITGRHGIHGVYLIVEVEKRGKQLNQINLLGAILSFVDVLRSNGMLVILGYTNTEALLFSIADPTAASMGSYETTRIFNIRNFETEKGPPSPPNARIYSSRLMHWIDYNYIDAITSKSDESESYFDQTKYKAEMFHPTFHWHFQKPELYKHFFLVFSEQFRTVAQLEGKERWREVCSMIRRAEWEARELQRKGIFMTTDSDPLQHLDSWLTAATLFGNSKGWG